jgi:hypothetical protein
MHRNFSECFVNGEGFVCCVTEKLIRVRKLFQALNLFEAFDFFGAFTG